MFKGIVLGLMAAALCGAARGEVVLTAGEVDVVVAQKAPPAVRFAAEELTNFLSQALGAPVPIAAKPAERTAIVLGDCEWSRAAGIDVNARPRDTFFIRTAPNRIYLAGRDDATQRPIESARFANSLECATAFAVYAFLEDCAGCRFYFPGELGTIVPKAKRIAVPDTDRTVTPAYLLREWYDGKKSFWFGKTANDRESNRLRRLNWMRLRMGTKKIPLCHGTSRLRMLERFGKTHPEYFAMKPNGARRLDPHETHAGQFCWTSGIVDEIYGDFKAALTGGKPSDRGIPGKTWPKGIDLESRIVDCMPQDGQADCCCANCRELARKGLNPVWLATKKIAERLTAEGIDARVTQMCYGRCRQVPDYDLPTNILVQVAVRGQWSLRDPALVESEHAQIFAWQRKLGHKVWLWTYPGKHPSVGPDFDGIPQLAMHAWAKYYADLRDSIIGGFSESETDRFSFNYLNYYVYSRMCWDTSVDVDRILDEHYRLMFGAAAEPMKAFYTFLETKWMTKLVGESKDTEIGPVGVVPSWETIFREIYPPSEIAKLDAFVADALKRVPADSLEARRIRLFADEYVGGIRGAERRYREKTAAVAAYRTKAGRGRPIELRPLVSRGRRQVEEGFEVSTKVTTWRAEGKLHFRFVCEEPHMDRLAEKDRADDDPTTWQDNCIEIHLCPEGNRTRRYQIAVNSRGACYAARNISFGTRGGHTDVAWGADVKAKVVRGEREWTAEVEMPVAAFDACLGAFPANFARSRSLEGVRGSGLYLWGPETLDGFGYGENFGTVEYAPTELKVLMIGNSFSICTLKEMPKFAKAAGVRLDLCSMYIGGCSLERHWTNVVKADNPDFKPYQIDYSYASAADPSEAPVAKVGRKANIPELVKADRWDVITIQQASKASSDYATYQPFADNLIAKIREWAPQAEIVIQETWSYSPYSERYAKWKTNPVSMHAALRKAYGELAAKYGFRVIPTGDAVQLFRARLPVDYGRVLTKAEIDALKAPATIDFHGDVTGKAVWKKGDPGKETDVEKLRIDPHHFNSRGHYLQAAVWTAELFGIDPTTVTYRPDWLSEADAKLMRECARDAVSAWSSRR